MARYPSGPGLFYIVSSVPPRFVAGEAHYAVVVGMADTADSKSAAERREGSTPSHRTYTYPARVTILRKRLMGNSDTGWALWAPYIYMNIPSLRVIGKGWRAEEASMDTASALFMRKGDYLIWYVRRARPGLTWPDSLLLKMYLENGGDPPDDVIGVMPWTASWPLLDPLPCMTVSGSYPGRGVLKHLEGVYGPTNSPAALEWYGRVYNREHPGVVESHLDKTFTLYVKLPPASNAYQKGSNAPP